MKALGGVGHVEKTNEEVAREEWKVVLEGRVCGKYVQRIAVTV